MNSNPEFCERISRSAEAMKDAINRFEHARASRNPADSFAPLGDAVSWITRLDRDLDKVCSKYRACRDKHEFGQKVPGHRFVRNLLDHDCKTIDLVDVVNGANFPLRYPVCLFELKWKTLAASSNLKKTEQLLAESYGKHLTGRLARETFREVLAFFADETPNFLQLPVA
jgi:hypothetical protein